MMKGFLYADGEVVGDWEAEGYDPGMGVVFTRFRPNESYKRIQPVILEHTRVGPLAEYTDEQRQEAWLKVQALNLEARTVDGKTVETEGGLWLMDYSAELDGIPDVRPYQLHLLGLSRALSHKYFLDEIREYYGEKP